MENKHTEGPWTYWSDKNSVGSVSGYFIAPERKLPRLAYVYNYPNRTEANAHLIAAAPELLEACERLVKVMPYIRPIPKGYKEAWANLHNAIARAKGGE